MKRKFPVIAKKLVPGVTVAGFFFISAFCLVLLSLVFSACSSTTKLAESKKQYDLRDAETILSQMSLEEKVAQLFVIIPEELDQKALHKVSSKFVKNLAKYPVGGFILFARHIENPRQLRNFTEALKEVSPIPPIIAVDEEGGRVARLARHEEFFLPKFANMDSVGKSGDVENARGAGQIIGSYLYSFGFNMDFAPVADVNTNPENIVIGARAFGSDPYLVSKMDAAFLSGLHSTGVKGCIKHFPGHGDTKGDTHAEYVAVTKTWDEIKKVELIPFIENFKNADCVMVAHVTFMDVDSEYPASLSKKLISEKLRGELGYDGLVLTDALDMGAIEKNYGSGEASLLAFEAGNDILLMPQNFNEAYEGMISAVKSGRISEERLNESVLRILRLKGF